MRQFYFSQILQTNFILSVFFISTAYTIWALVICFLRLVFRKRERRVQNLRNCKVIENIIFSVLNKQTFKQKIVMK